MSVCTGKIGIALNIHWCEPATNSTQDVAACERYQQFNVSKRCEEKREKMCVQIYIVARSLYHCCHGNAKHIPFLGAFEKLRKATTSFVMSVRPSFRKHGTTRLSLDGFSCNFIFEDFSKICREN